MAAADFQVIGRNPKALFTLKIHRGEGMALLAMNWKDRKPPEDFVGFAISYMEPGGDRFFVLQNRGSFAAAAGGVDARSHPTTLSPIQKFRWVHFPRNAELTGEFLYRVVPVFMNAADELSYGDAQEARLELRRETYPDQLNVTFTRGFVSSQAFVDRYESQGPIATLLPAAADEGLSFLPTHSKAEEALAWMGFEARHAILELLDQAIADKQAQVEVIAYDLSLKPPFLAIADGSWSFEAWRLGDRPLAGVVSASGGLARARRHRLVCGALGLGAGLSGRWRRASARRVVGEPALGGRGSGERG